MDVCLLDPSNITIKGILIFNKHLLFLLTAIVLFVGWLLFCTIHYFIEYSNRSKFGCFKKIKTVLTADQNLPEAAPQPPQAAPILEPHLNQYQQADFLNLKILRVENLMLGVTLRTRSYLSVTSVKAFKGFFEVIGLIKCHYLLLSMV